MLSSPQRASATASFLMITALVLGALQFHMIGACVAGFLIYSLTHRLSDRLERRFHWSHHGRTVAVVGLVLLFTLLVGSLGLGLLHFFRDDQRLSALMLSLADVLTRARASLPAMLANHIPDSMETLKEHAVVMLRTNQGRLSTMGMEGLHSAGHLLIGLIGGAMVSFARFSPPDAYRPLSAALLVRFSRLRIAFDKVVLAQLRISLINTGLTAVYLLVLLPLFGVHLPLATTMVAFTFGVGLLPVVGNLISNVAIVLLSLGVSMHAAIASLVFLILIHKLEYFLNARIIGHNVQAAAWEMILVMMGMEVMFGISGVIAAPVLYAYVKAELLAAGLIGRRECDVITTPTGDVGTACPPADGTARGTNAP